MKIPCHLIGKYSKNEQTGETQFCVLPLQEAPNLLCSAKGYLYVSGILQDLPKWTPLVLDCDDTPKTTKSIVYYSLRSYELLSEAEPAQRFFTSDAFPGIGPKIAEKITDLFPNIFQIPVTEENAEQLRKCGLLPVQAMSCLLRLQEIAQIHRVLQTLLRYGASYASILRYYRYETKQGRVCDPEGRPYSMLYADIPFEVCERIAVQQGGTQYAADRRKALVFEAFRCGTKNGHTKLPYEGFLRICQRLEERSGVGFHTNPMLLFDAMQEAGLFVKYEHQMLFVYHRPLYRQEQEAAFQIMRLGKSAGATQVPAHLIARIEAENNIRYAKEQKNAFLLLETPGVKVLTGGPGTGKTTVIKGLIQAYKALMPDAAVILCAPTGCAAKRLAEATKEPAKTIHKLLEIRPFDSSYVQTFDENTPLPKGLLIIDEASMVDLELLRMLLCAIQSGSVVLLSGDEDQLPSVGKGNVLHDLLRTTQIPSCRLHRVFRVSRQSLLYDNIQAIREGQTDAIKTGEDFQILRCENTEEIRRTIETLFTYSVTDPFRMRLFSPTKKPQNPCSTVAINQAMHQKYKEKGCFAEYVFGGQKRFSKNDPVICTENHYEIGLVNGDLGTVKAIDEEAGRTKIVLSMMDGQEVELSGSDMAYIEPAYAITVHRSQGGECDTAVVVLPKEPANMLQRSLFYVAVTRAKNNVIVISEKDALEQAIRNTTRQIRVTGLTDRLEELAEKKR